MHDPAKLRALEGLHKPDLDNEEADRLLSTILDAYLKRRDDTHDLVRNLRAYRLVEIMRRHQLGRTFKSTYNRDRIRTLEALLVRLREELKPMVVAAETKMIEIQFAEVELKSFREAEAENERERAKKRETGLYADTLWTVERLFRDFGIHRGHYAILEEKDLQAISDIMTNRWQEKLGEEGYDETMQRAKSF